MTNDEWKMEQKNNGQKDGMLWIVGDIFSRGWHLSN